MVLQQVYILEKDKIKTVDIGRDIAHDGNGIYLKIERKRETLQS